jgi:hypothetical protein
MSLGPPGILLLGTWFQGDGVTRFAASSRADAPTLLSSPGEKQRRVVDLHFWSEGWAWMEIVPLLMSRQGESIGTVTDAGCATCIKGLPHRS